MRILLMIPLLFVSFNVNAEIYFRPDGGNPQECNGTKDLPKSPDKNCAFKNNVLNMKVSPTAQDNIVLSGQGEFIVSVQAVPLTGEKINFSDFSKNFFAYSDQIKSGGNFIVRRPQTGKPTQLFSYNYLGTELDSSDFKKQMPYYSDRSFIGSQYVVRRYQFGQPTRLYKFTYVGQE